MTQIAVGGRKLKGWLRRYEIKWDGSRWSASHGLGSEKCFGSIADRNGALRNAPLDADDQHLIRGADADSVTVPVCIVRPGDFRVYIHSEYFTGKYSALEGQL